MYDLEGIFKAVFENPEYLGLNIMNDPTYKKSHYNLNQPRKRRL